MWKIYREEISRALINKRFLIVFLLAGISFTYGFFQVKIISGVNPLSAINTWQQIMQRGYYGFFACVIAVLPFADSLSVEKREYMLNNILLRSEYKEYVRAKFKAIALSGSLSVVLPAAILLMICLLPSP